MDHGYVFDLLRSMGASELAAETVEWLLVRPGKVVLVLVGAAIASRLAARAIARSVLAVHRRSPLRTGERAERRAQTVADAGATASRWAIWSIALLIALGELGLELGPLLAGAGIAGLAIGFGAQSLVKDVIAGMFLLLEDQYGVGDIVTLGDVSGVVEDVTLRVTRLRSVDGTVQFVPNGEVKRVGNQTMGWARVIVDVPVSAGATLERAQAVALEEVLAYVEDEDVAADVQGEPEVWGAVGADLFTSTVRVVVTVAAGAQYARSRELRGRLLDRLHAEGMRGGDAIGALPGMAGGAAG